MGQPPDWVSWNLESPHVSAVSYNQQLARGHFPLYTEQEEEEFRKEISLFFIDYNIPFSAINSLHLQKALQILRPNIRIPTVNILEARTPRQRDAEVEEGEEMHVIHV